MGEDRFAHIPPEQRLLIEALNQDRQAMVAAIREAVLMGISDSQLPRPVRAAKAGMTAQSGSTESYPADIPDDFDSLSVELSPTPVDVYIPSGPRMVLWILAGKDENPGVTRRLWFGNREGFSNDTAQQPHRIGFSMDGTNSLFVPVGRGIPVTVNNPLQGATGGTMDAIITVFHGPIRE